VWGAPAGGGALPSPAFPLISRKRGKNVGFFFEPFGFVMGHFFIVFF
jgi:hypothetical protein